MAEELLLSKSEADDCPAEASLLNHVFASIRAVETQYATTVMMAVKRLAEELSSLMTGSSETRSTAEFLQLMASSRRAFEERIMACYVQRNAERQSLSDELKELEDNQGQTDVLREITRTELAIENSEGHIQWMLWDTSVDLGRIMRARLYQGELKAYLRGLRFQAGQEIPEDANNSDLMTSEYSQEIARSADPD